MSMAKLSVHEQPMNPVDLDLPLNLAVSAQLTLSARVIVSRSSASYTSRATSSDCRLRPFMITTQERATIRKVEQQLFMSVCII